MATKTQKLEKTLNIKPEMKIEHTFKTQRGVVVGRYHGQRAVTTTRNFVADTKADLIKKVKAAFENNTLDGELMLKESIAAGVEIVDTATVEIDGKVFSNVTIENYVVGDEDYFNYLIIKGEIVDTCPQD